jgi:hypothetical protein
MLIRALRRFLAPRYILVNQAGLGIQHGGQTVTVAWPDILAYGIGYAVAEPERVRIPTSVDKAKEMVAERLTDAAMEVLQVSGKRHLVLEIYPVAPHVADRYPRLRPYWKPGPAAERLSMQAPGLPQLGWRFALPPVVPIAQQIARGLYVWSPPRWAGWIRRPWPSSGK